MRSPLRAVAFATVLIMILGCKMAREEKAQKPHQAARRGQTTGRPDAPTLSACGSPFPPPTADTQFPPNFDYPQSATTLSQWVVNPGRNGHRQQAHAYCLFAGLNLPVMGVPAWRRWKTASQAFPYQYNKWIPHSADGSALPQLEASQPNTINESRGGAQGKPGDIRNPAPIYLVKDTVAKKYPQCTVAVYDKNQNLLGYKLKDGEMFQSNGDIMIAVVAYNKAAFDNITGKNLGNAATLDNWLPKQPTDPPSLGPEMPAQSIVLKVMYWPVAGGYDSKTHNPNMTALPVWNWDANRPGSASDGQYAGYEMQKFWKTAVAVSGAGTTQATADVTFLYNVRDSDGKPLNSNTYNAAPVVGLDRFYRKPFSDTEFNLLSPCDQALLHASANWAYNRDFQGGDSLVMIAMHIMTKEQQDWTFQTAWWHPDALACPAANNRYCKWRPGSVPSADSSWKNYMLTTTYGMPQQSGQPNYSAPSNTKYPTWPVAYNPYIELAASHPITTNCMNCHHRAAWPPDNPILKPDRGRASAYLQKDPANPNPLEQFATIDSRFKGLFNGLTMVDSMWGVSDRAGYPKTGTPASGGSK